MITFNSRNNSLTIYINGVVHLIVNKKDFLSLKSWIINANTNHANYKLEITYKEYDKMECTYISRENWEEILQILDDNLK